MGDARGSLGGVEGATMKDKGQVDVDYDSWEIVIVVGCLKRRASLAGEEIPV